MKEMRLFEVGLKEKSHSSSYDEKFYVVAESGEEAIAKARLWLKEDHMDWWNNRGGREDMTIDAYVEDKPAEEMSDEEILATEKYQKMADEYLASYLSTLENMQIAKLYDTGTAIV